MKFLLKLNLIYDLFKDYQSLSQAQCRKRKLVVIVSSHDNQDPMPVCFKHIKNSINIVRPEYYVTVDLLISKYPLF